MSENLIVTCALPYANGKLHLGHLLEQIQADIWVRFHKMQDANCYFICADDTHGTSIMLKAQELGISPEKMIQQVYLERVADFKRFAVNFDHYYTTHSEESKQLVYTIYHKLKANNKITTRLINQLYDEQKGLFLPDRFVKGACPKCQAADQYGDNCEVCGATYNATDLINAYSVISGSKPILKQSEHYFFKLSSCEEFLRLWLDEDEHLQPETRNKMQEWLNIGLEDWDISRDAPYFGFAIPDTVDKYFYVWLDAPVGYMSSLMHYCALNHLYFDELWNSSTTKIYHFIGKDILYFHALFWPSVLHYSGYKTPDKIFAHGFLTVNNQKMSKSRGTFITADDYINSGLDTMFYRYYVAAKSNNKIEDIDFSTQDFMLRVNSELIGKFINIAARSCGFLNKFFADKLSSSLHNPNLLATIRSASKEIAKHYEMRDYSKVVKSIISLADMVNLYIDTQKPWLLAKDQKHHELLQQVSTTAINAFYLLSIYLKPIIPDICAKVEDFLNLSPFNWHDLDKKLINHQIKPYTHLAGRIEQSMLDKLMAANNN